MDMPAIWIELAKFKFTFFEHVSLRDVSYEQTLHSAFLKIKLPALKHTIKKSSKMRSVYFLLLLVLLILLLSLLHISII